jgi:hypothetical protein
MRAHGAKARDGGRPPYANTTARKFGHATATFVIEHTARGVTLAVCRTGESHVARFNRNPAMVTAFDALAGGSA